MLTRRIDAGQQSRELLICGKFVIESSSLSFREKGVLIIGSGNMVHNLRLVSWQHLDKVYGYDWALEASDKMRNFILDNRHKELIQYTSQGKAFAMAIPSPEHYLPLLYSLSLQDKDDRITLFNDKPVAGAL